MKRLLFAALLVVFSIAGLMPARAHNAAIFYPKGSWPEITIIHVHIVSDAWFSTNVRDRILDGINEWNDSKPALAPFLEMGNDWGSVLGCDSMNNDIEIYRTAIDGAYGATNTCFHDGGSQYNGNLYAVQLALDTTPAYNWYAADCSGNYTNQVSLCGVITHELGHAEGMIGNVGSGVGHFSDTDASACTTGDWTTVNTMCSGNVWPHGQWWRASSLEAHDVNTWGNEF